MHYGEKVKRLYKHNPSIEALYSNYECDLLEFIENARGQLELLDIATENADLSKEDNYALLVRMARVRNGIMELKDKIERLDNKLVAESERCCM